MTSRPLHAVRVSLVVLFCLLGPCQLALALVFVYRTHHFLERSVAAQARVVQLKPVHFRSHPGHSSYLPVFSFAGVDGHSYTVTAEVASSAPNYKIGQQVTVHYEESHPERARIDSFLDLWGFEIFHVVTGFFFTFLMLVALFARLGTPRTFSPSDAGGGVSQ